MIVSNNFYRFFRLIIPGMKNLLILCIALLISCVTPQIHVSSKFDNTSVPDKSIAVFFRQNSIKFFFDHEILSTKDFRSPSGIQFDSTASPKENFKKIFIYYATENINKFSNLENIVLSSHIDNSNTIIVTELNDSIAVPANQNFIKDFSEIDYALIFDNFDIIYTDCGMIFTTISGKCAPELQVIATFTIVSNKGDGLIQYGTFKEYYEYIKPKTGMFSKPDPNFLNVRYPEWEVLIKLTLRKIFKSGPFAK